MLVESRDSLPEFLPHLFWVEISNRNRSKVVFCSQMWPIVATNSKVKEVHIPTFNL
jgi:uncharacterized protein affecting Mg2+/Co2+ transport